MQKCLPPREFSPPYATAPGFSSDPDNQFLGTDLALLQGWAFRGFLGTAPTLGPKISVTRS
jgi:hypothetical protein